MCTIESYINHADIYTLDELKIQGPWPTCEGQRGQQLRFIKGGLNNFACYGVMLEILEYYLELEIIH